MPFSMGSCDEEGKIDWSQVLEFFMDMLGWNFDQEDTDNVPDTDPFTPEDITETSKSWENKFPSIGDQGSYGTCVAWATGYATKTALNNMDSKNFTTSPVDLWHLISSSDRNRNCDGTSFEPAFVAMQNNGVASMSDAPFTNKKMTCDGVTGKGNADNKLGDYRIIAYTKELNKNGPFGMTVANFKGHLQNGPIAIGARLGERFMQWNNSSILSSDTEKVQGQHAYHALVVVGFDDSKSAFRIRNSWGTDWGDNGSIWIDYDFFITQFCFGAWIASNPGKTLSTSASLRSAGSANDLQMEILKDYETTNGSRIVEYDIKNTGSATISADKECSVVYLLFRKNRLSERYILFQDYYSNEGKERKTAEYILPWDKNGNELNGDFYMVLVADASGNVDEMEKENNICFITGKDGEPLKIVNGKITNMPTGSKNIRTLVSETDLNNYSGVEILQTLQRQLKK